jgi:hypothetical protein
MREESQQAGGVFISYSRQDKVRVLPFVEAMRRAGVPVWIDEAEIDALDDFPARIREGLARSRALLAWYSPRYAESGYCQKELTAAWIAAGRVTRDILSRIVVVNPETEVAHIALGDVGRQNYLAAPAAGDELSCVEQIRARLEALSGDFAAVDTFTIPPCYPDNALFGSSRFVGRLHDLWRIHIALNPVWSSACWRRSRPWSFLLAGASRAMPRRPRSPATLPRTWGITPWPWMLPGSCCCPP